MKRVLSITLLLFTFLLNVALAKGFGKSDIVKFCTNKELPIAGKQFDGKYAIKTVLSMVAGKYSYPNGGALLLFSNNYYILKLPRNRDGIHGTATDDLLASGGIVGGCSKEQLSEAIRKNNLSSSYFKLIKRYR